MDQIKAKGGMPKAERITVVTLLATLVLAPGLARGQQGPATPLQHTAIETALRMQIQNLEQQLASVKGGAEAISPAPTPPAVSPAASTPAPAPGAAAEPPKPALAPNTIEALEARIEELERELVSMREQVEAQQQAQEEQKPRVEALEKKAALDRLNFSGDIRLTGDTLNGSQTQYYDGLKIQNGMVNTMFYMMTNNGAFPMPGPGQSIYTVLDNNVKAHYSDYLLYTSRLTFTDLKGAVMQFPPAAQAGLMQMLMPEALKAQQDYNNSILYTTRIRLNMRTEVAHNLAFAGRLAMYKVWGDSTGVQVFNGQPTSINIDGTTVGVPNSDIVRVDRAYFDWNQIGGSGLYLSVGRRPSTGGPPTEQRLGRLRGGTPLGHVVDYQFDGITVGYSFGEKMKNAVWRFCYGLGYESGFGSGDQLQSPANRLKDVHMAGANLDMWSTDTMNIQATALRAMRVTDGFNSLVVMPADPVTGNPAPGPAVMRFTPSSNIGDIDLAAVALERFEGPFTWFSSVAGEWTHPNTTTTPFGGLLSDPFSIPESHDAWSLYSGVRYDVNKSQIGFEYNHGSKYWFNFTAAADDILLSKLAVRGNVYEAYFNQTITKNAQLRISGLQYDFQYSGSGWHLGEPKPLAASTAPTLGFPTYNNMFNLRVAFDVHF